MSTDDDMKCGARGTIKRNRIETVHGQISNNTLGLRGEYYHEYLPSASAEGLTGF